MYSICSFVFIIELAYHQFSILGVAFGRAISSYLAAPKYFIINNGSAQQGYSFISLTQIQFILIIINLRFWLLFSFHAYFVKSAKTNLKIINKPFVNHKRSLFLVYHHKIQDIHLSVCFYILLACYALLLACLNMLPTCFNITLAWYNLYIARGTLLLACFNKLLTCYHLFLACGILLLAYLNKLLIYFNISLASVYKLHHRLYLSFACAHCHQFRIYFCTIIQLTSNHTYSILKMCFSPRNFYTVFLCASVPCCLCAFSTLYTLMILMKDLPINRKHLMWFEHSLGSL